MVTTLKVLRMNNNMTQAEAAQKAGLSQPWYSLIESGRLQPSETQKKNISIVFGISADKLFQKVDIAI